MDRMNRIKAINWVKPVRNSRGVLQTIIPELNWLYPNNLEANRFYPALRFSWKKNIVFPLKFNPRKSHQSASSAFH
jgi:hypothetical protein